ncbi:MAG: DUF222 domain-containing protein [Marmoricola sp.]
MDTTTPLTATDVIDGVREAKIWEHHAAVRQVELAVQWALLHPCRDEYPAGWEDPRMLSATPAPLAGPGTPLVDEYAPASLAAALGITLDAGRALIADALELTYRLPRLWDLVVAGTVPVWRARQISQHTHDLGTEAVAYADRLITAVPAKVRLVDAARLVHEARLYFDPDRAVADEEHELARRGVWVRHTGSPATTDVFMTLDTPDALLFDQTVGRIAHELHELGDTDSTDVRRARAVGILADPQYALDLMSGREGTAPSIGTGARELYLHLTPADLTSDAVGGVSVEQLGAITTDLLADWLARHCAAGGKINVRPVLDLASERAVDQHDPPPAMREHVILRDAHCVFPGCRRDSRGCDLDHITAYVPLDEGGPPGQTTPANLAPLCRTHHRIKTHTAWDYKTLDGHGYLWTAPTGHQYEVTPAGRRPPDRQT